MDEIASIREQQVYNYIHIMNARSCSRAFFFITLSCSDYQFSAYGRIVPPYGRVGGAVPPYLFACNGSGRFLP